MDIELEIVPAGTKPTIETNPDAFYFKGNIPGVSSYDADIYVILNPREL